MVTQINYKKKSKQDLRAICCEDCYVNLDRWSYHGLQLCVRSSLSGTCTLRKSSCNRIEDHHSIVEDKASCMPLPLEQVLMGNKLNKLTNKEKYS